MPGVKTRSTNNKPPTEAEILGYITTDVGTPRVSILFIMAMGVVSALMILLPILYVGLIALVGWLVYMHAVHNTAILTWHLSSARTGLLRVAVYGAPIIAGVIVFVFMTKPLFARPAIRRVGLTIDENHEPLLVKYIEKLCESLGAPVPREIKVDCDPNASAGFRNGLWGLLSNRLTLTIGLPLVAALDIRQLSGVLAHEFGHFTQWTSMRLSYVIKSINNWFARVVYEEDSWDEWLLEQCRSESWISLIFLFARLCVWITRRILWALMIAGQAMSCVLSRQMEYDADRCEALIGGSESFKKTTNLLPRLSFAHMATMNQAGALWRERRLPDNLPALLIRRLDSLTPENLEKMEEFIREQKSGWFDTHPPDDRRIANIDRHPCTGVISSDAPADVLFSNFEVMCKAATLVFYRENVHPDIGAEKLVSTQELAKEEKKAKSEHDAVREFLGHAFSRSRVLILDNIHMEAPADPAAAIAKLKKMRTAVESARGRAARIYEDHEAACKGIIYMTAAKSMADSGLGFNPKRFELTNTSVSTIESKRIQFKDERERTSELIVKYEAGLTERINLALQLLCVPQIQKSLRDGPSLVADARRMLRAMPDLQFGLDKTDELLKKRVLIERTVESLDNGADRETGAELLIHSVQDIVEIVREMRLSLATADYPFEHSEGKATIAQVLADYSPHEGDPGGAIEIADEIIEGMYRLHMRVLGRLIGIAHRVEKVVGAVETTPKDAAKNASPAPSKSEKKDQAPS